MSTQAQKKAIKDFRAVTGATEKAATDALTKHKWNLERAVDEFLTGASGKAGSKGPERKIDATKLNKIFDTYAGKTEKTKDIMEDEKLAEFFTAIGIDPEAGASLTIAYRLKCKSFGKIRRQEFIDGWGGMGAETIDAMKVQAAQIAKILDNKSDFKDFYKWLFDYVKEEGERKTIDATVAIDMWNLTFTKHFPLLPKWIKFMQAQNTKAVSADLWTMVYEFARDVKPDLSNYDPDSAWPAIVDEFVEYVRAGDKS